VEGVKIVSRFWAVLLVFVTGGAGVNATREIVPVAESDSTILPVTKGVAATRDDISVVVAYLKDVKALDGFGVMIVNETSHWISFKKEECVLIQSGEVRRPLDDPQVAARLGGSYKPKMPEGLAGDISEWRRDVNSRVSRGFKVSDEDKTLSIISGTRETVYLYFNTREDTAPIELIIPNIYNEATKQRTRFSFKFVVEKK